MLQKYKEQQLKLQHQKESQCTESDQMKKLMQERRKVRNTQITLPKNAKLNNGLIQVESQYIQCQVCSFSSDNLPDYTSHLSQNTHLNAIHRRELEESSKRQAVVDIQSLENESTRDNQKQQAGKLTKTVIERINKEVEEEWQQQMQQEPPCQQLELPKDFFDNIEVQVQLEKQIKAEMELKQQQNNNIETEVPDVQVMLLKQDIKHRKIKQSTKYEFLDELAEEQDVDDFALSWKAKK